MFVFGFVFAENAQNIGMNSEIPTVVDKVICRCGFYLFLARCPLAGQAELLFL